MMNGDARRLTRIIVAASMGNALEWYDFTVFGYFALQISAAFFPATTQATALLLTWGTFGASFLARPLGAVVLGSYADRKGRRAAMTASILLMSVGTLLMAVIPGYASIGFAAPVCVLLARLMQGFSAGGEFGGATAFMIEHGQKRRGFFGSFQFTSQSLAQAAGAGTAWALSAFLSAPALHDWGFRIPFLIGLLIGPVGFYVRRHVDETPVFDAATADKAPALALLRAHPGRVLLGATTIAAGTAGTYLNTYLPTYAQTQLHMALGPSFAVPLIIAVVSCFVTPLAAHMSDRIGRIGPMIVALFVLMIWSYPAFILVVKFPTFAVLLTVMVVKQVLQSWYTAPLATLLAEIFPTTTRGVGMSVTYSLGVLLFGSFTPLAATWLVQTTGDKSSPGYYLAGAGLLSLAALVTIRQRIPLHL
jgi:MHS family proline/betaine transporter-like MFS transporter